MQSEAYLQVIYHFFLDGAKIIFGSLVVGLFTPNAAPAQFSSLTLIGGLALTFAFLMTAQRALQKIRRPLANL